MRKRLFIAVICCCIFSLSASEYGSSEWNETLDERLIKLQEDSDLTSHYPNLTIHVFYYNVSQNANRTFNIDDELLFNNETNQQQNCHITSIATLCSQVNIFEVVKTLPYTTEYLEITNSPVHTLRHSILSNVTRLVHLKLTNNSIQYITSKFFIGLENLRILNLSDNNIRALTKVAFKGCPNLVSLDLSRNRIISLRFIPAAFAPLHNLTILSLSGNIIRIIKQNELADLLYLPLKSLDLSYCTLSIIERGSFSHLGNLEQLILKVTYLNEEALSNATYNLSNIRILDLRLLPTLRGFPTEALLHLANSSIEFIDFSLSEFSFIPFGSFPPLPNLKRLRFFSSLISEIEDGAFDGLTSLEFLDLSSNRLSEIPSSISVLKNLVALSLTSQKTDKFEIPDYSLSNLTSLRHLRLEHTPIKSEITRFTFHGLINLTTLWLYDCEIFHIRREAFKSLSSLELLELSFNKIFSLNNDTLYGLRSLKLLGLKANSLLIGYNSQPFVHTKSLEKLLLQENELRVLRPGIFSGMMRLRYLNLTRNKIIPWNFSIFEGTAPVNLLLKGNEISYATPAMLEDFRQVTYADVSSNPFYCRHCQIEEFRSWLLSRNYSYLEYEDHVVYDCFSPPDLYGYSIFESDLQLDHCFPPPVALEIRMAIGFSILAVCTVILIILGYYFRWYFRYWWFHLHASVKRVSTSSERTAYLYDAFVSYNSADITWVTQKLIRNLENHNSQIRLCLHDRDFEVGRLITENILESIDKSKKVLLVLTSSFAKSEWCLFELHVAQHRLFHDTRDALVLIQVEALQKEDTSKHLRYLMKTRTLLVWPDNPEKQEMFWANLHRILSS